MDDVYTGVLTPVEPHVPLPSCPLLLRPQHCKLLSDSTAQVAAPPAAIMVAVPPKVTCTGSACVPPDTPKAPQPLSPQHHTVPSVANTHVWIAPATIRFAMRAPGNAVVFTGVQENSFVNADDPSWLYVLSPQHQMTSSTAMAHVCLSPAAIRPVGSIAEIEIFARTRTGEGTAK